ncbi:FUSC family protein [Propionibacteriaceae bacterium Y1923]
MDQGRERGWQALVAYAQSRIRSGWARVRGATVPNTQSAVMATIAWLICRYVLGQEHPIFSAIACYLAMGFSRNRQPRRVLEIGLGATFGVFVGEMVDRFIGFGWWQVLLIMLFTPLVARFIDRSDLMTFQSTINAMVVASMASLVLAPGQEQSGFARWIDALVGSGVALVASIILPTNITTRPRRYASTAILRLADGLAAIGDGLAKGDGNHIRAAFGHLQVARHQITDGGAALSSAVDLAMINPRLRAERVDLAEIDRLLAITGRMHTSMTMLARQARAIVGEGGPSPEAGRLVKEVARAMRHLATSVGHWNKPVLARSEAAVIAKELAPLEVGPADEWRTAALVSLLRAVVVDLLQLTGLSHDQARVALTSDTSMSPERMKASLPREEGSSMWGTISFPAVRDEGDGPA